MINFYFLTNNAKVAIFKRSVQGVKCKKKLQKKYVFIFNTWEQLLNPYNLFHPPTKDEVTQQHCFSQTRTKTNHEFQWYSPHYPFNLLIHRPHSIDIYSTINFTFFHFILRCCLTYFFHVFSLEILVCFPVSCFFSWCLIHNV